MSASLCSDQRVTIVGDPWDGLTGTTQRLSTLTKTWDVKLDDGRTVCVRASRLKVVEKAEPVQRQFTDWGRG